MALAEHRADVPVTVDESLCIKGCRLCVDVCPLDCITFTENAQEEELRHSLLVPALNPAQAIYVSAPLKTGRVAVKDEDLCLHCGLCAERCPTGAWDMQKFLIETAQVGQSCHSTQ